MNTSYQRKLNNIQQRVINARKKGETEVAELILERDSSRMSQRAGFDKLIDSVKQTMDRAQTDLNDFLLDALPFLQQYEELSRKNQSCVDLTEEFQRQFNCPDQPVKRKLRTHQEFPTKCDSCQANFSYVDCTADANYICTNCGLVYHYAIANGVNGLTHEQRLSLPSPPYTYKPLPMCPYRNESLYISPFC